MFHVVDPPLLHLSLSKSVAVGVLVFYKMKEGKVEKNK